MDERRRKTCTMAGIVNGMNGRTPLVSVNKDSSEPGADQVEKTGVRNMH